MVQSKKPMSSREVRHLCKFHLQTDTSHDTQGSRALNTQLPHVIAEYAIHLSSSNGWAEFWPEPMKFLVNMLNHVVWLRIFYLFISVHNKKAYFVRKQDNTMTMSNTQAIVALTTQNW